MQGHAGMAQALPSIAIPLLGLLALVLGRLLLYNPAFGFVVIIDIQGSRTACGGSIHLVLHGPCCDTSLRCSWQYFLLVTWNPLMKLWRMEMAAVLCPET